MKINYIKEIDDSKVYDVAEKTPISLLNKISTKYNNTIFLKREDLQPIFSFKCRGAYNKISSLNSEQILKGIIAASAGNHAQGVALSASKLNINALIVMPTTTPSIKIESVKKFGVETVVAINHFVMDTENEIKALEEYCNKIGVKVSKCTHWSDGGKGIKDLAKKVIEIAENSNPKNFKFLYDEKDTLWNKIEKICKEIYKASNIIADENVKEQLKTFEKNGYGKLPVCIAKTQYSFSIDPKLKGAPSDHEIPIREVRLSSGAEFIVVVCGSIMTMPGLPRVPAADSIKLNDKGEIEGLF